MAKEGSDSHDGNDGKFKIKNEVEVENENDEDENVSIPPATKVEIKANEFEIVGTITSISGNTFVVAGQTIVIDPTKVSEFEQKGILATGTTVKVEGPIISGTNFAKEIKVFGSASSPAPKTTVKIENNNKFEISGVISAIAANTFTVTGQTITVDLSQVRKFEQKGILAVGKTVKVEGVIVNNTKIAKEIKVFDANGQEVIIEIKNVNPVIALLNQILILLGLSPITP